MTLFELMKEKLKSNWWLTSNKLQLNFCSSKSNWCTVRREHALCARKHLPVNRHYWRIFGIIQLNENTSVQLVRKVIQYSLFGRCEIYFGVNWWIFFSIFSNYSIYTGGQSTESWTNPFSSASICVRRLWKSIHTNHKSKCKLPIWPPVQMSTHPNQREIDSDNLMIYDSLIIC